MPMARPAESTPELAEVVVGVEVAPAHPLGGGHSAEDGVRRPGAGALGELVQFGEQGGAVGGEVGGPGASDLLVDLWRRGHAGGPLAGEVEGEAFVNGYRDGPGFYGCGGALAERAAEGVGEVADRLVGAHRAPQTGVCGAEESDAVADAGEEIGRAHV